jgi:predicted MFS family arabinose efflux permease
MFRAIVKNYREAFSGLPRTVWLLATASLVNRSGTMVLPFLALFLTERRGFSTTEAGQVLACYGLGGAAGTYLGGWLSDRFDASRVMVGSLVLTGAGFLILGHLEARWAIFVTVFFLSLVGEAFRPANSSAIAAASPPAERTKAFALYRLAINLGMTLGPALGGFLAARDYSWLFRVDGATCILAAGFLWMFLSRDARAVDREEALAAAAAERSPWRDGPFMALAVLRFVLAMVTFQIASTFPLTLRDFHRFSKGEIGLVLGVNTLVIVLFEMVLVHRLSGRDPLKVVAMGSFLFCLGMALLPLGSGFAYVAFTVIVWTVGEMLTFPVLAGAVANRAGEANRGRYMAIFTLSFEGAFVIAPLAGTWIYQNFGPRALWLSCGAIGFVLLAGYWLLSNVFAREAREQPAATLRSPAEPAPRSEG